MTTPHSNISSTIMPRFQNSTSFNSSSLNLIAHLSNRNTHPTVAKIPHPDRITKVVPTMSMDQSSGLKSTILLTNDDGICPDSALILPLARELTSEGHNVVICAPGRNNSACGQRITLGTPMTMRRHCEYEQRFQPNSRNGKLTGTLSVFSIDEGTPSDCIIAGIEPETGLLARLSTTPRLVVSGINIGQNLGTDVLYSGTFSAARQAAMYGLPAIALSLDLFTKYPNSPKHQCAVQNALRASSVFVKRAFAALPENLPDPGRVHASETKGANALDQDKTQNMEKRLKDAFSRGDIAFNINIPYDWNGTFVGSSLDSIWYRSVIDVKHVPSGILDSQDETVTIRFSGKRVDRMCFPGSDVDVLIKTGAASVSPVSAWPLNHALALPQQFFSDVIKESNLFWQIGIVDGVKETRKL